MKLLHVPHTPKDNVSVSFGGAAGTVAARTRRVLLSMAATRSRKCVSVRVCMYVFVHVCV